VSKYEKAILGITAIATLLEIGNHCMDYPFGELKNHRAKIKILSVKKDFCDF